MKQQDDRNKSGACFKSRTEDDQNIAKFFGKKKLANPFPNGYDFHLEPLMPIKEMLISLVHPVLSCYHQPT
jgi:hypothetical protein